jgi:hypothetical protein
MQSSQLRDTFCCPVYRENLFHNFEQRRMYHVCYEATQLHGYTRGGLSQARSK